MKKWNLVLTSHMHQEQRLLQEVAEYGEFHPSGFREVILGAVPDPAAFLEVLRRHWEERPGFREILSTAVPVRVMFPFTLEDLLERLKEEVRPLAPEIAGHSFCVRVKRRGHKGEINSQQVEQALDRFLSEELTSLGYTPRIEFVAPEYVVAVEIIHNQAGVGLIGPDWRQRYPFVKLK